MVGLPLLSTPFSGFTVQSLSASPNSTLLSTPFSGFLITSRKLWGLSAPSLSTPFSGFVGFVAAAPPGQYIFQLPFRDSSSVKSAAQKTKDYAFNSLFGILWVTAAVFSRVCVLSTPFSGFPCWAYMLPLGGQSLSTPFSGFILETEPPRVYAKVTFNSLFGILAEDVGITPQCPCSFNSLFGILLGFTRRVRL